MVGLKGNARALEESTDFSEKASPEELLRTGPTVRDDVCRGTLEPRAEDRRVRDPQGIQGVAMAGVSVKPEAEPGEAGSMCTLMSDLCLVSFTQQLSRWKLRLRQGKQISQPMSRSNLCQGD